VSHRPSGGGRTASSRRARASHPLDQRKQVEATRAGSAGSALLLGIVDISGSPGRSGCAGPGSAPGGRRRRKASERSRPSCCGSPGRPWGRPPWSTTQPPVSQAPLIPLVPSRGCSTARSERRPGDAMSQREVGAKPFPPALPSTSPAAHPFSAPSARPLAQITLYPPTEPPGERCRPKALALTTKTPPDYSDSSDRLAHAAEPCRGSRAK
jgi:hypothetical protein